jgi:hypothetical protein
MFNNKQQLLCSNNLSLEMNKCIKICIWSVSVCGSETWTCREKWRESRKCILNMELERNVKNKMDR